MKNDAVLIGEVSGVWYKVFLVIFFFADCILFLTLYNVVMFWEGNPTDSRTKSCVVPLLPCALLLRTEFLGILPTTETIGNDEFGQQ